jgi:2-polyprenyl-3-methyl-5-hydroxy-6-metoxy-1,4-benzoquinol methylase
MFLSTKFRSDKSEIMDDFAIGGHILKENLDEIAKINQLLGGNQLTLQGLKELIVTIPKGKEIKIVDIGCGNGDMLRIIANYGIKNNCNFQLLGIDANNYAINYARELSMNYPNISYSCENIFSEVFNELKYDILLCTLTLHHFKYNEIIKLMTVFNENSKIGIVINDLHRTSVSYRLFQVLGIVFRLNNMSREDGLTSILRGFKRHELVDYSEKLNFKKYTIHWKWAFRYQWIIKK